MSFRSILFNQCHELHNAHQVPICRSVNSRWCCILDNQHTNSPGIAAFVFLLVTLGYLGLASFQISAINDKVLHFLAFFLLTVRLWLKNVLPLVLKLLADNILLGARHSTSASAQNYPCIDHSALFSCLGSSPALPTE